MSTWTFEKFFLLFFIYSVIGWLIEVTLVSIHSGKLINRGFFMGPYLPIYGSGATLITLSNIYIQPFDNSYGSSFLISLLICGALEYLTSYYMEKRFKIRWWDYSSKPMNLHGRIWIGNLILFGLAGVSVEKLINPILFQLFAKMTDAQFKLIALILAVIFITDWVFSNSILKLLRTEVFESKGDSTEKIAQEIKLLFSSRSIFHRRLLDAYPRLEYRTDRIKARLEKIKTETERVRGVVMDKLEAAQDQFRDEEKK